MTRNIIRENKNKENTQWIRGKMCIRDRHKGDIMTLRTIVLFRNSPSYRASKDVSKLLTQLYEIAISYNIENSKKVIEKLQTIEVTENTKLMSFDVKDVFTNILITETIELIKNNSLNNVEYKEQLLSLIHISWL